MRRLAPLLLIGLVSCQSGSLQSAAPDTPKPFNRVEVSEPPTAAERQACASEGGVVRTVGLLGRPFCVQPYPDAGAVCTHRDDCLGRCVAGPNTPRFPPKQGERVEGICKADTNWQGCFTFVDDGMIQPVCAD